MITAPMTETIIQILRNDVNIGFHDEKSKFPFVDIFQVQVDTSQTKSNSGIFIGDFILKVVDNSSSPKSVFEISRTIFQNINQSDNLKTIAMEKGVKVNNVFLKGDTLEYMKDKQNSLYIYTLEYYFNVSLCN